MPKNKAFGVSNLTINLSFIGLERRIIEQKEDDTYGFCTSSRGTD